MHVVSFSEGKALSNDGWWTNYFIWGSFWTFPIFHKYCVIYTFFLTRPFIYLESKWLFSLTYMEKQHFKKTNLKMSNFKNTIIKYYDKNCPFMDWWGKKSNHFSLLWWRVVNLWIPSPNFFLCPIIAQI